MSSASSSSSSSAASSSANHKPRSDRSSLAAHDDDDASSQLYPAHAFPLLFDSNSASMQLDINQLTPISLNQQSTVPRSAQRRDDGSCSSSSSGSQAPASSSSSSSSSSGLELTIHESHTGNLIGSVVWEGGRVLAWILETMHDHVRELHADGSGFIQQRTAIDSSPLVSAACNFDSTSPTHLEYLRAQSNGVGFDIPRNFLVGARVLELGAGTGITGLACVKLGAAQVVLTDIKSLLPLLEENVRRNCPGTLRKGEDWRSTSKPVASAAPAAPAAPAAVKPAQSTVAPSSTPPAFEYEQCSNCDDLTVGLLRCEICDVSLCDLCDASWHRPANKSSHERSIGGIFAASAPAASTSSSSSSSSAASSSCSSVTAACMPSVDSSASAVSTAATAAVSSADSASALPAHCDVYVEELMWGDHSSVSALPLCLRAPFDVIVMADVVYDAYSTVGVGSEDCDNFRRLFETLCLLVPEGSSTTVLMTYTPRRAHEKSFFELLSTVFVWTTHPATALLPDHTDCSVDDRIWIYHLHRSRMAGRIAQEVYIHQTSYDSELNVANRIHKEREERRKKRMQLQQQEQPMFVSASTIPATPIVQHRPDSPAAAPIAAPTAVNLTPTLTRYLENEEDRQQAQLRAKLERRATKSFAAAQKESLQQQAAQMPHL